MKSLVLRARATLSVPSGSPSAPLLAWSEVCVRSLERGELSLFREGSVSSVEASQGLPGGPVTATMLFAVETRKESLDQMAHDFNKRFLEEFSSFLQEAQERWTDLWVEGFICSVEVVE